MLLAGILRVSSVSSNAMLDFPPESEQYTIVKSVRSLQERLEKLPEDALGIDTINQQLENILLSIQQTGGKIQSFHSASQRSLPRHIRRALGINATERSPKKFSDLQKLEDMLVALGKRIDSIESYTNSRRQRVTGVKERVQTKQNVILSFSENPKYIEGALGAIEKDLTNYTFTPSALKALKARIDSIEEVLQNASFEETDQRNLETIMSRVNNLFVQKAQQGGGATSPMKASTTKTKTPTGGITKTQDIARGDAAPNRVHSHDTQAYIVYLNSLLRTIGSVIATRQKGNSLGDGRFRKGAVTPLLLHFVYLLQRNQINPNSFSWQQVVSAGYENRDSTGIALKNKLGTQQERNNFDANMKLLFDIIEETASNFDLNCILLMDALRKYPKFAKKEVL